MFAARASPRSAAWGEAAGSTLDIGAFASTGNVSPLIDDPSAGAYACAELVAGTLIHCDEYIGVGDQR